MNEASSIQNNSALLKNSYGLDETDTMTRALKKRREKAYQDRGLNDEYEEKPEEPAKE